MGSDFRDESLKSKLILTLVVHNLIIGCCTYPIKTSEQKKNNNNNKKTTKIHSGFVLIWLLTTGHLFASYSSLIVFVGEYQVKKQGIYIILNYTSC